ncbi:unnamed protein product, partial [Cladocopium goreaui]
PLATTQFPPETSWMDEVEVRTVRPGDGITFPKPGDKLMTHYICRIRSTGQQIDSSYQRRLPFRFQLGVQQVIKGWDLGICRMSLGEKAILTIPANLAYGQTGAGGSIPPDTDLTFEVELLRISAF